jgi:hypothetical protein
MLIQNYYCTEGNMITNRRMVLSIVLALLVAGLMANTALAFDCNNPNLNGKAVLGTFDIATETFTPAKANFGTIDELGNFVKLHGAWIKLVFPWGDSYNIFVHGLLPDGARNAGPGNDGCDGKGIDDLDACLAMTAP